jgi:carbon storage regulator
MLVLSRKVGERILIADRIVIEVLAVQGRQIRLGFEAPPEVAILRAELSEGKGPATGRPRAARKPR